MRNHWSVIFYHIIIKLILNIFVKTLHILQKDTKVGNFGYQLWICTRLLMLFHTRGVAQQNARSPYSFIQLGGCERNSLSAGPWLNIKMSSYQYRKSHCGDKTVVRSSYLHNGISYTGKMTSLYWIGAQGAAGSLGSRDLRYNLGFDRSGFYRPAMLFWNPPDHLQGARTVWSVLVWCGWIYAVWRPPEQQSSDLNRIWWLYRSTLVEVI